MKKLYFVLLLSLLLSACSSDDSPVRPQMPDQVEDPPPDTSRTPCVDGLAGIYPCAGIDLLGHMDLQDFGAESANDIWGWTDPETSKEYAILGLDNGTAFIDISSEPAVYVGKLPTHSSNSPWRDVKVLDNYAFIVSEAADHGMQVFDLRRLREAQTLPASFTEDAHYDGVGNAHNLVINPGSQRAYVVGTARDDTYSGGVHILDVSQPLNPTLLGGYGEQGYTHDAQVVTYSGPDASYQGREVLIASNETQLVVADLTDPANPQTLATFSYPNLGYTHQGWFTEDQRYFLLGDETDELQFGFNSRTLIFDLQDLEQPLLAATYTGATQAIDHNGYVREQTFYLANYTAGVRLISLGNIGAGQLEEVAFFDTYPADDDPAFNGVWSVYPYFSSGKLVVGDINSGLFILAPAP